MKSNKTKTIVIIICFFLLNLFWVTQDNRLPFIGDDARFLMETNNLANILKAGDLAGFANKWQDLFIVDTNSVPRTPLFTLLSVPTFMLFGPSTDAAVVTNLIVFALCSWLVYVFVQELFKHEKQKELIGLLAVIMFNVFPGYYGMARMYMSEIVQTAVVILIAYLALKWGKSKKNINYLWLGLLAGLAMLLRFIIPIYLVVPALIFIYQQWQNKYKLQQWLIKIGLFVVGFIPVAASWYGKNLVTYWNFTTYTSYGSLGEVTSLGPVWSTITWLKFWKVIGLWHFSWPVLLMVVVLLITAVVVVFKRKLYKIKLKKLSKTQWVLSYLAIIPLPALLMTTLSANKTARYFLPVEVFWIILGVYVFWLLLVYLVEKLKTKQIKYLLIIIMFIGAICCYPFAQSVINILPQLPASVYLPSSGKPLKTDASYDLYDYILSVYETNGYAADATYLIPEQVRLNDAELQWFFCTNESKIDSIGELSPQHSLEDAIKKVDEATILVIDYNAIVPDDYRDKYLQLVDYVISSGEFEVVDSKEFNKDAKIVIMKRLPIYALQ